MRWPNCATRVKPPICAASRSRSSKKESDMAEGKIKIKLVRSPICTPETHKSIVRALGLRKINQVVERPDNAGFRGMVAKIPHLLQIVS
ncbi:MAG: 50S ribosomal protein L30 [Bryobacterales bacterium]|nr:50S ribosomal protein L30 [Bryobacterales bacterium]